MFFFGRLKHINPFSSKRSEREESRILSERTFHKLVERERRRADRNKHQFSLVLFDSKSTEANNSLAGHMIKIISQRVRNVDELGWYDNQHIGIILPYTSTKGAYRLVEQLYNTLDPELPKPVCDVFTYPS